MEGIFYFFVLNALGKKEYQKKIKSVKSENIYGGS